MVRCEMMRALPAGSVGPCDRYPSHKVGWKDVCYEHFVDMLRRPDLWPSKRLGPGPRDAERVELSVDDEAKFRDVLVAIFNAPDYHSTNEVP
jgi:hypothetical protein